MFAITIFGDSIVFGRGDNKGWVGRLKEDFQAKDYYNVVYNLGIPGDTSSTLLKRFDTECKARIQYSRKDDKHVLIIGIGINDSRLINKKPETSLKKFESNIKQLVKKAKKYTENVIFIGLTQVDERAKNYEGTSFSNDRIAKYNEIIKKQDVMFIEMPKVSLDDGLHPDSKGYDKMYKIIKGFLVGKGLIE
jgi:lysophospholipase L1-like esterase